MWAYAQQILRIAVERVEYDPLRRGVSVSLVGGALRWRSTSCTERNPLAGRLARDPTAPSSRSVGSMKYVSHASN